MVSLSNNTQGNVNITTKNGKGVNLTSNNDTDVNANMNGNAQRAKSWAVGEGLIDGVDYSAKYYAQEAKESEDIASHAIENIDTAKEQALSAIDTEKTEAIADMETAKEEKISEIEDTAAGFEDDLESLTTRAETAATNAEIARDAAEGYAQEAEQAKDDIEAELDNYVPNTRKVNNKPLSTDITLTASDIGALANTTKYGYSVALSLDTTNYKLTLTLKDQGGTALSTKTVDFPIESVVVNGSYDSTNKKIVLTLQSGSTIDIPVGDLISGLQSEITSTNKLDSDLVDDTSSSHKFATAAQLNQIATNTSSISNLATVATSGSYNDLTNKPTIPTDTNDLTNGAGFITSSALSPYALSSSLATVATSGSYNDLSNKPTIPDAQVQVDWDVTDTTSKAYIKNKPYIPSGVVIDQTYDGTSANAQSGVAINGAGFLKNTATATNSLTILGTTNNQNNSILIGYGTTTSSTNSTVIGNTATSSGSYATALGYYARANGQYTTAIGNNSYASYQDVTAVGHNSQATAAGTLAVGSNSTASAQRATSIGYSSQATQYQATALGYEAKATANSALQIGTGTNSTANTLQVGSYTLLNTSTGLIPDARISSNIARTSQIPSITIDQTYDGTSANAQSGVAIEGELANYVKGQNGNITISNTGTTANIMYQDDASNPQEIYGVLVGQTPTGNSVTLVAGNMTTPAYYMAMLTPVGFGIGDMLNNQSAVLTVSNNNLAVNGSEVALKSDIPDISTKQDTLVSGTNIKTINNTSILGSGDIDTKEIFVAEYGSTTLNELNEAYNAGKEIFCYYQTVLCNPYSFVGGGTSSAGYSFVGITGKQSIVLDFTGLGGWSVSTINLADTDLSNLSATGKTVLDGQWVVSYSEIVSSNITLSSTYKNNWSLSTYLPNDNYIYEVIFSLVGTTANTSGAIIDVRLGTDIVKNSSNECHCMCLREQTRNSSTVITCGTITLPVGTGRKVYIQSLATGTLNTLRAVGYRRIGTNT